MSPYFNAIKAEFEAEGTRFEELAILNTACNDLGINLTLKIGGPLAKRDIMEALQLGASSILVPMVESSFIAQQSIGQFDRLNNSFGSLNKPSRLYMNIETVVAAKNCASILEIACKQGNEFLKAVVIGRSDLAASLKCSSVEDSEITAIASEVIKVAKEASVKTALGGNITRSSRDNIRRLHSLGLNYYETRKCTFELPLVFDDTSFNDSIRSALLFELSWLEFKRDFYEIRSKQDDTRIAKIVRRMKQDSYD